MLAENIKKLAENRRTLRLGPGGRDTFSKKQLVFIVSDAIFC